MHRMTDIDALGLDPERAELLRETFALHAKVHDEAMSIAGPLPTPSDLTMQQVRVLGFIAKDPGMAGHELGERLQVSAPTASGLVDRLVEKGLVSRTDDPDDRRVRRLHVTPDGMAITRQLDSLLQRAMLTVIQNLTAEDLVLLRDGAQVMLDAMARTKNAVAERAE